MLYILCVTHWLSFVSSRMVKTRVMPVVVDSAICFNGVLSGRLRTGKFFTSHFLMPSILAQKGKGQDSRPRKWIHKRYTSLMVRSFKKSTKSSQRTWPCTSETFSKPMVSRILNTHFSFEILSKQLGRCSKPQ